MAGHVRDRWTSPGPNGRRVRNDRWGKGSRWQARWTDRAGKEHAQTFSTKDAADTHLRTLDISGPVLAGQGLTFGEYAEIWRASQLHLRSQTGENVDRLLKHMITKQLGHIGLLEVSRADVQSAVITWSADYSPSRIRTAYGYVKAIYKHAIDDRLVQFSPCVRISIPRQAHGRVHPITTAQMFAIRDAIPAHYRHMVELGAATGLRGGELRGLTVGQINQDTGELHVDRQLLERVDGKPVFGPPKTETSDRVLQLPVAARDAIKAQLEDYPVDNEWSLLFLGRTHRPLTRQDANSVWRENIAGMGLPARHGWHALRHYCASLLIADGLSVRAVADWLGHADVTETLQTYSHLWPSDQGRIVAAIDNELRWNDGPETDQS